MEQFEYSQQQQSFPFGDLPPEMQERVASALPYRTLGRLARAGSVGHEASRRPLGEAFCGDDPNCSNTLAKAIRENDGVTIERLCRYGKIGDNTIIETQPPRVITFTSPQFEGKTITLPASTVGPEGFASYAVDMMSKDALVALLLCGFPLPDPAYEAANLVRSVYAGIGEWDEVDPQLLKSAVETLDVIASEYGSVDFGTMFASLTSTPTFGEYIYRLKQQEPKFGVVLRKMWGSQ